MKAGKMNAANRATKGPPQGWQRFKLTVEYDGTAFCGWQRQKNGFSVQEALEQALEPMLQGRKATLHGSGRTDAGVHATGQVGHFDAPAGRAAEVYMNALNARTPRSLSILACEPVPAGFHSRYHAYRRSYQYHIITRPIPPAIERERVWHLTTPLDEHAMSRAGACLIGQHDFSAFRAAACQAKSPVKTMYEIQWLRNGDALHLTISANAFLQHMVRNLVGSLVLVGKGERPEGWIQQILEAKNRVDAGPTAPAHALYLTEVCYPDPLPL
uniref:tRNA pseudouridine synthase A n=1 Tax=Magnetococcus massalia (strain MO-1) TaxID=451514 RepID=A0A1S7LF60_MAGMO|nr:tRNA pseudouridine synthase A [Candidatus Magnetococcus massalia]